MNEIGALILTQDDAGVIEDCLRSLRFCAERVVVDEYSRDDTVTRAWPWVDRMYQRQSRDETDRLEWGLSQMRTPWVLCVAPADRVPANLADAMQRSVGADGVDAYFVRREHFAFGRRLHVREPRACVLWRAGTVDVVPSAGPRPRPGARIRTLTPQLIQRGPLDWASSLPQLFRDSQRAAQDRPRDRSPRVSWLAPARLFWREFVWRGRWRDGVSGWILSGMYGWSAFLEQVRVKLNEFPPVEPLELRTIKGPAPHDRPQPPRPGVSGS